MVGSELVGAAPPSAGCICGVIATDATTFVHRTFVVPHHEQAIDLLDHVESNPHNNEDRSARHEVEQDHAGRVARAADQRRHDRDDR